MISLKALHLEIEKKVLTVLSTTEKYAAKIAGCIFKLETAILVQFLVEYPLRIWSAGCHSR